MFGKEKHTEIFLKELLVIACVGITAALLLMRIQESRVRNLLYRHDEAAAVFLLKEGIPKQTVMEAIEYARGDVEEAPDIPTLRKVCVAERVESSVCCALFLLLLFLCVFRYLQRQDRICREAIAAIENCGEGDFSLRLPELYDGTLYQLFSRINFMAAMLKTKQETENKVKEFLKMTVSDISHQLKTPLAALSMYLEIIRDEPEQADTVAGFAEKSVVALGRMEGLIQMLLKLTRLDAGSVSFTKRICNAKELVLEALEGLADRAGREGKDIMLSGEERAKVYCDPYWSREALENFIKNALDHTSAGNRICIAWEETPLLTRFVVEDTGEGIAEEDIHHIFKRFYRSENTRNTQGTGLGLSLAKSIADGQGGTISVQSGLGEGTTFVLAFPDEAAEVPRLQNLTKS